MTLPCEKLTRQRRSWAVVAWLSCVTGAQGPAIGVAASPAPLCPSVLLFHKPHHNDGVRQIERIAELGFRQVQVIASLTCRIDKRGRAQQLGRGEGGKFRSLGERALGQFQRELTQTFQAAAEHDLQVAVLGHLNSAGPHHQWRNNFAIDPQASYSGYTYQQAMVEPVIHALAAAGYADQSVDFALCGEMGRSVFLFAPSYRKIIEQVRRQGRLPQLKLGVSLNFNNVAGEYGFEDSSPKAVQRLFDACDFLGISNYRPFTLPPTPEQFGAAIENFFEQLASQGVQWDLQKPLHFSEIGIGGGREDHRLATTPEEAAQTPWQGSDRSRRNPWKKPELRALRVAYHRALLDFLAHQPAAPRVTAAYLWSEGSWDPLGTIDEGFEDEEIRKMILDRE